ncbi:hypothetical protein BB558_005008 [Smittium angustum]|uniref:Cation-transporting ATPase n=1 Tax=Smittium angustum TaxID=133377 RepID=A0A2U1J1S9_SMIAN|nr:hypothetical protein BB558_005008 [Smittium angustum]
MKLKMKKSINSKNDTDLQERNSNNKDSIKIQYSSFPVNPESQKLPRASQENFGRRSPSAIYKGLNAGSFDKTDGLPSPKTPLLKVESGIFRSLSPTPNLGSQSSFFDGNSQSLIPETTKTPSFLTQKFQKNYSDTNIHSVEEQSLYKSKDGATKNSKVGVIKEVRNIEALTDSETESDFTESETEVFNKKLDTGDKQDLVFSKAPNNLKNMFDQYDTNLDQFILNENLQSQKITLIQEDIELNVYGMIPNRFHTFVYTWLCILTCGIFYVLGQWFPAKKISFIMNYCDLNDSTHVKIVDTTGETMLEEIKSSFYGGRLEDLFGDFASRGPLKERKGAVVSQIRSFSYRHHKFIFHPLLHKYLNVGLWKSRTWVVNPQFIRKGLSLSEKNLLEVIFGINDMEIEQKSTGKLLIEEVLNPFYIFQIASVLLWLFDNYVYYAACIMIISTVSVITTLIETKRNTKKIQEMAQFECKVEVFRDGIWRNCSSHELFPGDIINMSDPDLKLVPCDAILLEGTCISNESMLTGESVPVAKTPTTSEIFDNLDLTSPTFSSEISKHILFSGTTVIRTKRNQIGFGGKSWLKIDSRYRQLDDNEAKIDGIPLQATAMVLRTGFNTTKGVLIRSILFPRHSKFKLYEDAFKFIGVLAIVALLGFTASVVNFIKLGLSTHVIVVRALDLITVVVPPALPASMSIGTSFSLHRLRLKGIFCISPSRINVCGRINLVAFDKTGTLTEEGLDVLGAQPINPETGNLDLLINEVDLMSTNTEDENDNTKSFDLNNLSLINGLATCHSIKVVYGKLIGDPLDVKMFESTGWSIEEHDHESNKPGQRKASNSPEIIKKGVPLPTVVKPPKTTRNVDILDSEYNDSYFSNSDELGIVKVFDFSSSLRRMSVVTRILGSKTAQCYVKGAPETIKTLCLPDTIPPEFLEKLAEYTHHGYRVIALAGKLTNLSWARIQRLKREQVECDLTFLGFVVFENKLKPTSEPVLHELQAARVRTLMCTGDNILTAISVARQCGMVPETTFVYIPRLVQLSGKMNMVNYSGGNFNAQKPRFVVLWQEINNPLRILDPYTYRPLLCDKVGFSYFDSGGNEHVLVLDEENFPVENLKIDSEVSKDNNYTLAISGDIFRYIVDNETKNTVNRMLMLSTVYARMSPDEKGELVELLQEIGYCTSFCGDGANDCSALRAADVGISLSEAESSVAAPFTSRTNSIGCVVDVMKEGRAALYDSVYNNKPFVQVWRRTRNDGVDTPIQSGCSETTNSKLGYWVCFCFHCFVYIYLCCRNLSVRWIERNIPVEEYTLVIQEKHCTYGDTWVCFELFGRTLRFPKAIFTTRMGSSSVPRGYSLENTSEEEQYRNFREASIIPTNFFSFHPYRKVNNEREDDLYGNDIMSEDLSPTPNENDSFQNGNINSGYVGRDKMDSENQYKCYESRDASSSQLSYNDPWSGSNPETSSWLEMGKKIHPIKQLGKKKNIKTYKKLLKELKKPN